MTFIVIATRNTHKVQEIGAILGKRLLVRTLLDLPCSPAIVEDGLTFEANAQKKAASTANWIAHQPDPIAALDLPGDHDRLFGYVLADDSGLEVDYLNGAPGVHSARFAAVQADGSANASDRANNEKLLGLLARVPMERRTARFRCIIALASLEGFGRAVTNTPAAPAKPADSSVSLFEGVCEGRIGLTPCGQGGFGYDPLFLPEGYSQTLAELGPALKNQISHRAQALHKVRHYLRVHAEGCD